MRKRLLVALVAAGLAVAVLALWPWLAKPRHGISPDGFYRVRPGMTRQEVEGILGGPPIR